MSHCKRCFYLKAFRVGPESGWAYTSKHHRITGNVIKDRKDVRRCVWREREGDWYSRCGTSEDEKGIHGNNHTAPGDCFISLGTELKLKQSLRLLFVWHFATLTSDLLCQYNIFFLYRPYASYSCVAVCNDLANDNYNSLYICLEVFL